MDPPDRCPIFWGNRGAPASNLRGEFFALATFISTSLEGDQAIQGFNFLIPADSIHAPANAIGLTPKLESTFTQAWNQAVEAVIDGRYREALGYVDAADQIVPGLIHVERAPGFEMGTLWLSTIYLQSGIKGDSIKVAGKYAAYFRELADRNKGAEYFIGDSPAGDHHLVVPGTGEVRALQHAGRSDTGVRLDPAPADGVHPRELLRADSAGAV